MNEELNEKEWELLKAFTLSFCEIFSEYTTPDRYETDEPSYVIMGFLGQSLVKNFSQMRNKKDPEMEIDFLKLCRIINTYYLIPIPNHLLNIIHVEIFEHLASSHFCTEFARKNLNGDALKSFNYVFEWYLREPQPGT